MVCEVSDLELSIIKLMECAEFKADTVTDTFRMGGKKRDLIDAGNELLKFRDMSPRSAFGFDAVDLGRLYTADSDLLLASVPEIIGREAEAFAVDQSAGVVKWMGLRRINRKPHFISSLPGASIFYEYHFRSYFDNGIGEYGKRCLAYSKHGKPMPVWARGVQVGGLQDCLSATLVASVIEDASRPMAVTATIHEDVSLTFPVSYSAYKDFFKLRTAPITKSGRRKAIAHWVAKHSRRSGDDIHDVSAHKRGVSEIDIDGLRITLSLN